MRDDGATAQENFPSLERTCRYQYHGWPRNNRYETVGADGEQGLIGPYVRAVLDCPPLR